MKYKRFLPIIFILILAAILRLWQLDKLPIGLFGDEVDVGYHAWSLWTTGRDYMGQLLPTYIHSLSEWRAPLLMYWVAPFVGLLKPSVFSVRLPIAIMGIANVWLVYLLGNKLFKNRLLALFAALILAITPWHIHYSRAAFEVTLLLTLLLSGVLLFLKALEKPKLFYVAFIPFVLTFYTYSTASVFTPLLAISLLLIYRNEIKKVFSLKLLTTLLVPIIIGLPFIYQVLFGAAAGRFKLISIFSDSKITDSIILARTEPWSEGKLETIFHNKPEAYLQTFTNNYLQAFSANYLFLNGDPNFRQSTGRFGELLILTLPFVLIGAAELLTNLNKKPHQLILGWLFLSPIPSALTQDGGTHATRLFLMLPPLMIITGLGLVSFYKGISSKLAKYIATVVIAISLAINLTNYWHYYSVSYRSNSSIMWNYGYESIFHQLKNIDLSGKNVYINNTYAPSLIHFAFHTQLPPKQFLQEFAGDNPDAIDTPLFHGYKFGNQTYFGKTPTVDSMIKLLNTGDIYLAVQGIEVPGDWDWTKTPPKDIKVLGSTNDPRGNKLFYIVTKI